jgi:hypothetical protein
MSRVVPELPATQIHFNFKPSSDNGGNGIGTPSQNMPPLLEPGNCGSNLLVSGLSREEHKKRI